MKKWLLLFSLAIGCEKADKETTPQGPSVFDNNDTGGNPESGCPSDVPEKYQYLWDCENEQPGPNGACSSKLYRYGVGESTQSGDFTITEKWFSFTGANDYCVDTFQITGNWSTLTPETGGCSTCESIYEVQWTIQDAQCGVMWDPFFADQPSSSPEEMHYTGYLTFDTHEIWALVNEDYGALVISKPTGGTANSNYAFANATPTYDPTSDGKDNDGDGETDEADEGYTLPAVEYPDREKVSDPWVDDNRQLEPLDYDFKWANDGDCLQ
jgi:hypothetical protein